MIGLDTNVDLRYLLQDDPAQTLQANHILSRSSPTKILASSVW
jgi:predicted nucleic-acid-binding protein